MKIIFGTDLSKKPGASMVFQLIQKNFEPLFGHQLRTLLKLFYSKKLGVSFNQETKKIDRKY